MLDGPGCALASYQTPYLCWALDFISCPSPAARKIGPVCKISAGVLRAAGGLTTDQLTSDFLLPLWFQPPKFLYSAHNSKLWMVCTPFSTVAAGELARAFGLLDCQKRSLFIISLSPLLLDHSHVTPLSFLSQFPTLYTFPLDFEIFLSLPPSRSFLLFSAVLNFLLLYAVVLYHE